MAKTDRLCWYCGEPADTIDHFIPNKPTKRTLVQLQRHYPGIVKSAPKHRPNLLPACQACNGYKENKLLQDWRSEIENRIGQPFRFYGETVLKA